MVHIDENFMAIRLRGKREKVFVRKFEPHRA